MADTARCSSCGQIIIWTVSPTGARLPLDARPMNSSAYIIRELGGEVHALKAKETVPAMADAPPIHLSHFVTCPKRDQHSTGRVHG